MEKQSFLLFIEHEDIFNSLTDKQAGQLIKAIFKYEKSQEIPQLDRTTKVAFVPIKQMLDKNREKYMAKCAKNAENGKKGGRPKGSKNNPTEPKETERLFYKTQKSR